MPKYRIGIHPHCPFANITVLGTNFPQHPDGVEVEMSTREMADIKANAAEKEVRFFDGHRAGILPKGQNRKDGDPKGDIVRGPPCRKASPLGAMLWIEKVEAPKASKSSAK